MRKAVRILMLVCLLVVCMGAGASAKTVKNGWIKKSNRFYYYENGKKIKGLYTIDGQTYFFGKKGRQQTSWRKVGESYYYFNTAGYMTKGYMLKNTTKNGIKLKKNGKAVLSTPRAKKKVEMMVRVSELLDKVTREAYSQKKKLKLCYDFLRKKIPYRTASTIRLDDPDRDIYYVNLLLDNGYADCHPYASTFAYLANAIGYEKIKIISADNGKGAHPHSYVRIGKKYYDPSLGRFEPKKYKFFGLKSSKMKKYMKKYYHTKIRAKVLLSNL